MNKHMARIKYINQLLANARDFFDEFKKDLINKRIRGEMICLGESQNISTKTVEGTVTNISFYEYDITITITTDDGKQHFLSHENNFEVIE